MSEKLSYYDRKRLFEAMQSGLSNTMLKEKFGITDNRTLSRHLKLAQQEEEAKLVKLGIIKSALIDHLEEIRTLIKEWKSRISTPEVTSIYFSMPTIPTDNIEAEPLFCVLKEHLPFPTLWRSYATWKTKVRAYIEGCQQVMTDIREVENSVPEEVLKQWGTESTAKAVGLSDPLYRMRNKYKEAVEADPGLTSLLEQLQPIETKLHGSLEEILLRRDHITYTCKLCPGQARLSR